jgi:hypothetical protein
MEKIKDILMRRDSISEAEANKRIEAAREAIDEVVDNLGSLNECEEIVKDHLGLEPDYLDELLFCYCPDSKKKEA